MKYFCDIIEIEPFIDAVCSNCRRHSKSPYAKTQCKYLFEMIEADGARIYVDDDDNCSKFLAKYKKKHKEIKDSLLNTEQEEK